MVKGQAKCEFGTGDILITPFVKEDMSKGAIALQNKGVGVIGAHTSSDDFKLEENDTILSFTKTESIDVLIERLEQLKDIMNGNTEGCYWEEFDW